MNGLHFANGQPASMAKGRYQTRSNRVVEIDGSEMTAINNPDGTKTPKKLWHGTLFRADGITSESRHTWSDSGSFLHVAGVSNPHDLWQVISQDHSSTTETCPRCGGSGQVARSVA